MPDPHSSGKAGERPRSRWAEMRRRVRRFLWGRGGRPPPRKRVEVEERQGGRIVRH